MPYKHCTQRIKRHLRVKKYAACSKIQWVGKAMRKMTTGTQNWKTSFFCSKFYVLIEVKILIAHIIAHIWDLD